jgi:hypothetical protein
MIPFTELHGVNIGSVGQDSEGDRAAWPAVFQDFSFVIQEVGSVRH